MKNVFISTSPNIQRDDMWLLTRLLFQPWKWKNQGYVFEFERQMERYLNAAGSKAVAFDSARSSFYLLLKEYGIGEGDEVLMPSFTCIVVVNSVLNAGAKPVYIDTDPATFNIDLEDLKSKITNKTKAILVQHTFGVPVDVLKVRQIVGPNVKIIEDLAHILGGEIGGEKIGTQGDAAILTFGIEKMITTLRGGMVVVKDNVIYENLKQVQSNAPDFGYIRIKKWLLNPFIWLIATPTYYWGIKKLTIGRIITQVGHKLGLMGNMMESPEYKGQFPSWMPSKMPGVLAMLGMNQLKKLDTYNEHRRRIAGIYEKELNLNYTSVKGYTPLRFPVLIDHPKEIHSKLKSKHIIAGNWYEKFLFTKPQYLQRVNFDPAKLPQVSEITQHIINLPLHIKVNEADALRIVKLIKM